jgi:hypothetical protein
MALAREHFKKRSRPRRRPDDAGEASVRERILSAAFAAFMERGYSGQHARDRHACEGLEVPSFRNCAASPTQ